MSDGFPRESVAQPKPELPLPIFAALTNDESTVLARRQEAQNLQCKAASEGC
jgi:hypothetical protein